MRRACILHGRLESSKGPRVQIFREFHSWDELRSEFESNLKKARAFVAGSFEAEERQVCEIVLIHPVNGEWLPLRAEVVHLSEAGVGLELSGWDSERALAVERFVFDASDEDEPLELEPSSPDNELIQLENPTPAVRIPIPNIPPELEAEIHADDFALEPASAGRLGSPSSEASGAPSSGSDAPDSEHPTSSGLESTVPSSLRKSTPPPRNVQERVRRLNIRERDHMARSGTLSERVALERAYGSVVWDALLSNVALTGPEVARIAKNGTATIPHLTIIVGNASWISKPEVRRALLTNPRLTPPQIERVLRALPPAELRKLPKQTAYTPKVRAIARKMLPKT